LKHAKEHRIAVVSVGNSLRGDDGVAQIVCERLPDYLKETICYFNAESKVDDIPSFLANHPKAFVIDAMSSGGKPGDTQFVEIDLNNVCAEVHVNNAHGLSWLDELLIARRTITLPERINFFGIEAKDTEWTCQLSAPVRRKVRSISRTLTNLICMALEVDKCTKQPLHH
jgi:hydrogenase maturation protease